MRIRFSILWYTLDAQLKQSWLLLCEANGDESIMRVVTAWCLRKEATYTHTNAYGTEEAFKMPVLTRSSAFLKHMPTVIVSFRLTNHASQGMCIAPRAFHVLLHIQNDTREMK
jgi:hypothetical protein